MKRAHLLQFTHDESQGLPSTGLGQPEEKTQLAATPRGPALNTAASPDLLWTQATTQVPNSAVLCDGGNRWKQGGKDHRELFQAPHRHQGPNSGTFC